METNFSKEQLKDKDNKSTEKIIRKCVHCGFCNATCPTYNLLGDELDGPRGRIYLIKDMLENNKPANDKIVKHIDRCLSCYSCMTTCPSGVNYMHLIDHGRNHIEKTYKRPLADRIIRYFLSEMFASSIVSIIENINSSGRYQDTSSDYVPPVSYSLVDLNFDPNI